MCEHFTGVDPVVERFFFDEKLILMHDQGDRRKQGQTVARRVVKIGKGLGGEGVFDIVHRRTVEEQGEGSADFVGNLFRELLDGHG
jgi:hypothetical protein